MDRAPPHRLSQTFVLDTYAGLLVLCGPDRSRPVQILGRRAVFVGRDPSCDLVLADDALSRVHVAFEHADDRWTVRDLGSSHGTYVGDERVATRDLQPFDEITLG